MIPVPLAITLWLAAAPAATGCADPAYRLLDFWIGEWSVTQNGAVVGTNRVEKTVGGCAILEHWRDVEGGEGKSLFFFDLATRNWKQVWVTDTGAMKEKRLVLRPGDDSVRFQGEVTTLKGDRILDRTTLSPVSDGALRQIIEVSSDHGRTWRIVFDSRHERRAAK